MDNSLVKRQDAIDDFYKHPNVTWTTLDILEHINALPSAQPERKTGEWIPCSERLPKDSELVLVTYEDEFDDGSAKFPNWEIASYGVINKTWSGGGYTNLDVIAWMPLPEPYKGDSDDQQ